MSSASASAAALARAHRGAINAGVGAQNAQPAPPQRQSQSNSRQSNRGRQERASSGGGEVDELDQSESGASSRSSSRGSSPVILWRASNRVREALDIPNEMRSVFLQESDDEATEAHNDDEHAEWLADDDSPKKPQSHRKLTHNFAPQPLSTLERIALARAGDEGFDSTSSAMQELELNLNPRLQALRQRVRVARVRRAINAAKYGDSAQAVRALLATKPPPPQSSFTPVTRTAPPPTQYGKWYLPPSLWIAEAKPAYARSAISSRVNTLRPHMALGVLGAVGVSRHGRNTLQLGQAEYEEARTKLGLNGLASWSELQAGALLGSSSLTSGGGSGPRPRDHLDWEEDLDDDVDVAAKIASIKAIALDARARRRRAEDDAKGAAYERKRAAKKAALLQKALSQKGIFQRTSAAAPVMDSRDLPTRIEDSADLERSARSNPLKRRAGLNGDPKLSSVEEKVAALAEQIPQLHISAEFKAFIQQSGARVPAFLASTDARHAEILAAPRFPALYEADHSSRGVTHPQPPDEVVLPNLALGGLSSRLASHTNSARSIAAATLPRSQRRGAATERPQRF